MPKKAKESPPQWIVDLQKQHKGVSKKQLSKIVQQLRDEHQREMERRFK
jgi:hypothetical protein